MICQRLLNIRQSAENFIAPTVRAQFADRGMGRAYDRCARPFGSEVACPGGKSIGSTGTRLECLSQHGMKSHAGRGEDVFEEARGDQHVQRVIDMNYTAGPVAHQYRSGMNPVVCSHQLQAVGNRKVEIVRELGLGRLVFDHTVRPRQLGHLFAVAPGADEAGLRNQFVRVAAMQGVERVNIDDSVDGGPVIGESHQAVPVTGTNRIAVDQKETPVGTSD